MEQSVLALLQSHALTPTSDFETFHCFETREKNMKFLSGCLGYQKFWFHHYILRDSYILKTFLYCIFDWGIRNSESSSVCVCVFFFVGCGGRSEILNLKCCLGVRNSEYSPLFLEDQKFWILSRIAWNNFIIPCKQGDVSCEF